MTNRNFPHEDLNAASSHRPSMRVAKASALLEVNISTIYKLVRAGKIEAHRIGKRGVRIFGDSLRRYQENQTIETRDIAVSEETPSKASRRYNAAHNKALDILEEAGIL